MDESFWKKVAGAVRGEAEEVEPELMIRRSIGDAEVADPDEEARKKVSENLNKKGEAAKEVAGSADRGEAKKDKIVVKDEDFERQLSKGAKEEESFDSEWEFPSLDLLNSEVAVIHADDDVLKQNADRIKKKLEQFDINVVMHEVNVGPTVVQYTLKPADDVRLSKITALKADLTMALAAKSVRIEAPIPGKSLVGIEVPNENRANVHLREILESDAFDNMDSKLRLPMGRDVSGNAIVADLETMPHLLIAGATGSGKSVCINAFLLSLLYQNTPEELKLILIDPKRVELGPYNFIPYLLTPVIKDPDKAAISLRWVVAEMTRRYQVLSDAKKRNILEYNADDKIKGKLPKIIVVIDELADLMMASGREVEASICRIAQMARAVGIHLIVATQRPSVDVITGLIKANIPARVAFAVSSSIDSRTILDGMGAEDLLGRGDMLYMPSGMGKPFRVQGVFVSSKEVEKVTSKIKLTYEPLYDDSITSNKTAVQRLNGVPDTKIVDSDDELYEEAFKLVQETRKASASLFQRRLKIGYARAARLVDILEEKGVVGPANGAKPREILVGD
jgi:S-DNA-T family DNA segregation ATPase FtsK/SpoIIIE